FGLYWHPVRSATIQRPLCVLLPTALAGIGEMQNAAFAVTIEKLRQHLSDVASVRRRRKFVRDCIDFFIFLGSLDHPVDKTRSVRTKDPGDAHNEMPVLRSEHIPFSG